MTGISSKLTFQTIVDDLSLSTRVWETIPDIIFIFDLGRQSVIYANDRLFHILGYTLDELKAHDQSLISEMIHPDDIAPLLDTLRQIASANDEMTMQLEARVRHASGVWLWMHSRSRVFKRDSEGNVEQIVGMAQDITARKNMEIALQQNVAIYGALFDKNNDGVFFLDMEGKALAANQRAAAMLGYPIDELLTLSSRDMVVPDELAQSADVLARLKAGETIPIYERTFRKKDGSRLPVEINAALVYDANGTPVHIQSIVRDISRRKRDEATLRDSEARLEKLIQSSPVAMLVAYSLGGKVDFINRKFIELFGYTLDDLPNVDEWWRLAYPDEGYREDIRRLWTEQVQAAAETRRDVGPVEAAITCKDGSIRYIECRRAAIGEKHMVTFVDLTERREIEQALRESEYRHSVISDLIWSYACSYRYLSDDNDEAQLEWVIGAFEPITGHSVADAFSGFSLSQPVHPDDLEIFRERQRKLHSGQANVSEFRIFNSQGEIRWLRSYGRPEWDDEHRRVVRVYVGVQDITEHKLAEERAAELVLEREKLRLLTTFINNASHDLRTPLSVMNTNLYLYRRIPDPEKKEERLQMIEKQIGHMARLVDQLVVMSRVEGIGELESVPLNLNQIVEDIQQSFESAAAKKQIGLTLELDSALPPISGDSFYLAYSVSNIVENAIQFTPENGRVWLKTYVEADRAVLEVHDTGIGINPEDLPHIFEHFFKANKARTYDDSGSGMGLTIAQKVALLHGGQITVESVPGQGSVFRLALPLSRD